MGKRMLFLCWVYWKVLLDGNGTCIEYSAVSTCRSHSNASHGGDHHILEVFSMSILLYMYNSQDFAIMICPLDLQGPPIVQHVWPNYMRLYLLGRINCLGRLVERFCCQLPGSNGVLFQELFIVTHLSSWMTVISITSLLPFWNSKTPWFTTSERDV